MKLSLIVPSNRSPEQVLPLLQSLAGQRLRESERGNWEVIWVINGLPFASCQQLLSLIKDPEFRSHINLLYRPAANANEARNLGAEAAHGEYLWFLDDDLELTSPFLLQKVLDKCVDKAAKFDSRWAMGGSYVLGEASLYGKDYFNISQGFIRNVSSDKCAFLLGGFCVLPKRLFEEIGGFDPRRVWGGSELELNRKLRSKNVRSERIEEWTLRHHLELSKKSLVRKALAQGEGAKPYPDFRSGVPGHGAFPMNWNIIRYMTAFHIGLHESEAKRRFYWRFPFLLDLAILLQLALWRVLDGLHIVDGFAKLNWKILWHLIHLKNIGRAERLRHTEIDYHVAARRIQTGIKRIHRRFSLLLFYRELNKLGSA